jgi:UDP:flavonoid glycosyltransferase YjiC (YdhE family)
VALAPIAFISRNDPPVLAGINLLRIGRRLGPWGYDLLNRVMRGAVRRWERPLQAFRQEIGLPATDRLHVFEGQFSPYGTLALFDDVLTTPQPDWPPAVALCGAPLHDGAPADALMLGELQRFLDRGDRPLVFALGSSAVYVARDFWPMAIEVSRRLGRRAILLTGKALPLAPPDNVRAFDYVPYSKVFPHAAAIIHQVGIGTLSQAMRSGRPQLLVPVSFDQPDNAHRAVKLGVARVLPFQKVGVERLAGELRALLDDASMAGKAEALAHHLRGVDGAQAAADRIVAALDTARP